MGKQEWATLSVLTLSTFIILVDSTVVNIAVPTVLEDLGGTLDEATWTLVGFMLPFASSLLFFAKLGDIYGRRLLFVSGVGVFTLASLMCALSPSIAFLIGARMVQGIGA